MKLFNRKKKAVQVQPTIPNLSGFSIQFMPNPALERGQAVLMMHPVDMEILSHQIQEKNQ